MSLVGVLAIVFFLLCLTGAATALLGTERSAPRVLAATGTTAAAALTALSVTLLLRGQTVHVALWSVMGVGHLRLAVDPLAALFGATTGIVYIAGSMFAGSHVARHRPRHGRRVFAALYLLLLATVPLVLAAADVLSLMIAWEVMSVLIYLLVATGRGRGAWHAAYGALALGEVGALAMLVGLLLAASAGGSLDFTAIRATAPLLSPGVRWAVLLLTFFGFGVKGGLVPVNSWIPRAYSSAPAAFTPVLAGATLNLGLYGIIRVAADLVRPTSTGPGLVILGVGTVTALVGILYATVENDLRTVLAHSSIENAGLVTVGVGAGLAFVAADHPVLGGIAFIAALYHLVNHSVYKTLLFAGAGAVSIGAGTGDLDRLGGLIKRMPWTAALFLVGALAISAIPPLNGFVSEWLTIQALLRGVELQSTGARIVFALAGVGVALTAALAVTCFVKAFAMAFLGMARSGRARRAHEAPRGMRWAMSILAVAAVLLGILPTFVIPTLDGVATPLTGAPSTSALVPGFFPGNAGGAHLAPDFAAEFHDLGARVGAGVIPGRGLVVLHRGGTTNPVVYAMSTSYMVVVLGLLLGLLYLVVRVATRDRSTVREPRWDGGVRRYLPEMTYTATGFSNPVRVVFAAVFRPTRIQNTRQTVAQHFLAAIHRESVAPHVVERYVVAPAGAMLDRTAALLARMHSGRINTYALYVLLTLLILLAVGSLG